MGSKPLAVPFSVLLLIAFAVPALRAGGGGARDRDDGVLRGGGDPDEGGEDVGTVVRKEERTQIAATEYGEITAARVADGGGGVHLRFVTLEPNALFLPVLLRSDMVLYVHTGRGRLNWADENDVKRIDLRRGDIYRLRPGTIFYVQSSLEPEREKLRINAIFTNTEEDIYEPSIGAYSSIGDLLRGFDSKVLQGAFKVPKEVVEEVISATRPPPIVHAAASEKRTKYWDWEARFLKTYLSSTGHLVEGSSSNKKTKTKTFNVFHTDHDFENCNGWSLMVTGKDMHALKHSNIGVFMVNLTKGSMMGPHWNPRATEIAIVLQGQGMIRVVCSSTAKESECNNTRFKVSEGDVFVVPRFHPMAQMSFNNESLVFMGFSTSTKRNYPQFLAGKSSILRALDREILAAAFNVTNTTIHHILAPQTDSIILDCTSCAEEEERLMEEEIEKERREEEEEAKRREEEEEAKRREEEERARQEEEEREREREEEEEREREEEEERERERKEEEEREREREEEEERERKRQEEEEQEREREEEEARRREEEEREREEEQRREGGGGAGGGEREQEEARRREEASERWERQRQQERRRRQEAAEREQEEARRQEEEMQRRQEAAEREQEEARRQEKPMQRQQEAAEREQEEARRQEEEMQRRHEEEWGGYEGRRAVEEVGIKG
ncbi:hypothetical protein ACJRO7_030811 [Eucalyptus globulus]|uniref:Cupin type-1 domain-containing protein n=1 Tax=Eucalyptus globulus TaxID=34317 RepID=A0ABD3JQM6_EUCGL